LNKTRISSSRSIASAFSAPFAPSVFGGALTSAQGAAIEAILDHWEADRAGQVAACARVFDAAIRAAQ
jgi:hypothetical protein